MPGHLPPGRSVSMYDRVKARQQSQNKKKENTKRKKKLKLKKKEKEKLRQELEKGKQKQRQQRKNQLKQRKLESRGSDESSEDEEENKESELIEDERGSRRSNSQATAASSSSSSDTSGNSDQSDNSDDEDDDSNNSSANSQSSDSSNSETGSNSSDRSSNSSGDSHDEGEHEPNKSNKSKSVINRAKAKASSSHRVVSDECDSSDNETATTTASSGRHGKANSNEVFSSDGADTQLSSCVKRKDSGSIKKPSKKLATGSGLAQHGTKRRVSSDHDSVSSLNLSHSKKAYLSVAAADSARAIARKRQKSNDSLFDTEECQPEVATSPASSSEHKKADRLKLKPQSSAKEASTPTTKASSSSKVSHRHSFYPSLTETET